MKFLAIYTIIPAAFVLLQAVPIFFYDMVGEKKDRITAALAERRAAANTEETDETEDVSISENAE